MDLRGDPKRDLLRKKAERILSQKEDSFRKMPVEDIKRVIHELDVYQVELDMQNDELRKAQGEIEQSRAKYVGLYDFSPVGYFTLTAAGRIEEVNLTGAKLLGTERTKLVKRDFRSFIMREFISEFESHRLEVLASDQVKKCELKLKTNDEVALYVSLESLSVKSGDGGASSGDKAPAQSSLIRSAMSDITERKKTEAALRESEERNRYLSAQLLVSLEAERRRIAGDLHDVVGHALVNMKHQMGPILTVLRKEGKAEVKQLESITSILDNTIEDIKRIQQDLRPSMLEDLGLLVTIRWLCREFSEAHPDIRVEPDIHIEEKEVPASLKLVIFRIAQEALNNIAKHSKADLVHLSLSRAKAQIALTISDDGKGFDVKANARHGLGLVSMRERTELSQGCFSTESLEGQGTTVRASWLLK
jgi:signal transduction histidine kinase